MPITLGELKQAGIQAAASGDIVTALKIYWRLVDADPYDIEPRMKVADLLNRMGAKEAAVQVYQAVGSFGVRSGHPLISMVVAKILENMGLDPSELLKELAQYYSADSHRISKFGQRISAEHPETEVAAPDLQQAIAPEALAAGAARAAVNFDKIESYPENLHRLPLLSDLTADTFIQLCNRTKAMRLPHGAMVIREGEIGHSFFLTVILTTHQLDSCWCRAGSGAGTAGYAVFRNYLGEVTESIGDFHDFWVSSCSGKAFSPGLSSKFVEVPDYR